MLEIKKKKQTNKSAMDSSRWYESERAERDETAERQHTHQGTL